MHLSAMEEKKLFSMSKTKNSANSSSVTLKTQIKASKNKKFLNLKN